jgi:AcrR family transcriptional regulator
MTSIRNSSAHRVADDALLDAVRECVLSVGVRRTTLTDVARRAGVSRMTVYRRYPDVLSLVTALMTREFSALLGTGETGANARERLVNGIVTAVATLSANPLLRSVLERDPELLLPYLTERIGSTQRLAEAHLAGQLALGHADGSVRPAEVGVQARALYLIAQSFVLSHHPATTDLAEADLLAELASTLDRALVRTGDHS